VDLEVKLDLKQRGRLARILIGSLPLRLGVG
jgi:hypothetical protein